MGYWHRPPSNAFLAEYVALVWYFESREDAGGRERLLPSGTAELVINLDDDDMAVYPDGESRASFRHSVICGPHTQPFAIDSLGYASVMGVHFKAGGAYPFLGGAAHPFQNLHVGLEDIWGTEAARLRERLVLCVSLDDRFDILEEALFGRLSPVCPTRSIRYAIRQLERPDRAVGDLADRIGISHRRLIELFREEVGLTPKAYGRVRRFQRVIQTLGSTGEPDLGELALDCGYYDQAHFAHDFKAFSGLTPSAYSAMRTEHLNHVPIS